MSLIIHAHHLGHIYSHFPLNLSPGSGVDGGWSGNEKRPQFPEAVWKGVQQISLLSTRLISLTFIN